MKQPCNGHWLEQREDLLAFYDLLAGWIGRELYSGQAIKVRCCGPSERSDDDG